MGKIKHKFPEVDEKDIVLLNSDETLLNSTFFENTITAITATDVPKFKLGLLMHTCSH